jgi:hypothetical protein
MSENLLRTVRTSYINIKGEGGMGGAGGGGGGGVGINGRIDRRMRIRKLSENKREPVPR